MWNGMRENRLELPDDAKIRATSSEATGPVLRVLVRQAGARQFIEPALEEAEKLDDFRARFLAAFGTALLMPDGRRLYRFRADDIPVAVPDHARDLIDQVRWHGAVLVADGRGLIVVERWLGSLPVETLCELRRCAREVIAALHQRPRLGCQADARRRSDH
jgi:hypothetical protein